MRKLLTICIFLLISGHFFAQDCYSFHRKECDSKEGFPMKYDSQSKSAMLAKGQTSEFHMVAYHGLDYRISVCAEENLGEQIQFKIYEKERSLVKHDNDTVAVPEIKKELLYDNSQDSYAQFLEFTAESSMSLIIEIIVPGADGGSKSKLLIREMGCVGVLIEHTKSRKSGF